MKTDEESSRKKRKRDHNAISARITYHTPSKVFERIFRESSLEDTKSMVRGKIGLPSTSRIQLEQLRGEKAIVLEDEDDFQAFCIAIQENPLIDLRVTVLDGVSEESTEQPRKKKKSKAERHKQTVGEKDDSAAGPSALMNDSPAAITLGERSTVFRQPIQEKMVTPPLEITEMSTITPPPGPDLFNEDVTLDGDMNIPESHSNPRRKSKEHKDKEQRNPAKRKSALSTSVALSPASHEKASLILQKHREAIAERANKPKGKKEKSNKAETAAQLVLDATHDHSVEEGTEENSTKQKKGKRRKRTQPGTDAPEWNSGSPDPPTKAKGGEKISHQSMVNAVNEANPTEKGVDEIIWRPRNPSKKLVPVIPRRKIGTYTSSSKNSGMNREPSPEFPAESLADAIYEASKQPDLQRPQRIRPLCPICNGPFHLRSQCSVMLENGDALQSRLEALRDEGRTDLVEEIETFIASQSRKQSLRGTHGATPAQSAAKDVEMENRSDRSSSPSLGKRTRSGKARAKTPSDKISEDEVQQEDVQMKDNSRSVTPIGQQRPPPTTSPSASVSTQRSRIGKIQSDDDHRSRSLRETSEGADTVGSMHHEPTKPNGQVLVADSSSSTEKDDEEEKDQSDSSESSIDKSKRNNPSNNLSDHDSENRSSPVARVKVPGTPSRIQMMKNRHGTAASKAKTPETSDDQLDDHETNKELSQEATSSRGMTIPKLSQISLLGMRNMASNFFKPMTDAASRPQVIKMPSSQPGQLSDSSDSDDSSSSDDAMLKQYPTLQRASSRRAMPPRKSVLSQL
ncbi:hypothetical protein FRC17_000695 [Serendipita sp. 399]|nr:hypothetical protein FRC17_000695 [Serendipita sp. 399]